MNAIKKAAIVLTMTASTLAVTGPAMAAPSTHSAAVTVNATTTAFPGEIPPCVGCW